MKLTENKLRKLIRQTLLQEQDEPEAKKRRSAADRKRDRQAAFADKKKKIKWTLKANLGKDPRELRRVTRQEAKEEIKRAARLAKLKLTADEEEAFLDDLIGPQERPDTAGISGPVSDISQDPIPKGDHDPLAVEEEEVEEADPSIGMKTYPDDEFNYYVDSQEDKWYVYLPKGATQRDMERVKSLHKADKGWQVSINRLDKKYPRARSANAPDRGVDLKRKWEYAIEAVTNSSPIIKVVSSPKNANVSKENPIVLDYSSISGKQKSVYKAIATQQADKPEADDLWQEAKDYPSSV